MLRRLIGEDIELLDRARSVPGAGDGRSGADRPDPAKPGGECAGRHAEAAQTFPPGGKCRSRAKPGAAHNIRTCSRGRTSRCESATPGPGISKEIQERIFIGFLPPKLKVKETGLGLSTVYGIVTQLGGSISVDSEPGCGTAFEILLPRLRDEIAGGTEKAGMGVIASGTETVLVVEDQEPVRKFAVLALKERGYHVLDASNAADALQVAAHHDGPIHVLFTDLVMPHMTGDELANAFGSCGRK